MLCSIRLLAHRYVPFEIMSFAFGGWRVDIELWLLRREPLFELLDANQRFKVEKIEGLTEKVFRGDFDLVRTKWSFTKSCEPTSNAKGPWDFAPERSPQPRFEGRF